MANIQINIAPFEEAIALKNAIMKELKFGKINLEKFQGKKIEDIDTSNISPFIEILSSIDSSEAVNNALMTCLMRCTCNSEKITGRTFESSEMREQYYSIVFECLKVNLLPFFKGLLSQLKVAREQMIEEMMAESKPE